VKLNPPIFHTSLRKTVSCFSADLLLSWSKTGQSIDCAIDCVIDCMIRAGTFYNHESICRKHGANQAQSEHNTKSQVLIYIKSLRRSIKYFLICAK